MGSAVPSQSFLSLMWSKVYTMNISSTSAHLKIYSDVLISIIIKLGEQFAEAIQGSCLIDGPILTYLCTVRVGVPLVQAVTNML